MITALPRAAFISLVTKDPAAGGVIATIPGAPGNICLAFIYIPDDFRQLKNEDAAAFTVLLVAYQPTPEDRHEKHIPDEVHTLITAAVMGPDCAIIHPLSAGIPAHHAHPVMLNAAATNLCQRVVKDVTDKGGVGKMVADALKAADEGKIEVTVAAVSVDDPPIPKSTLADPSLN